MVLIWCRAVASGTICEEWRLGSAAGTVFVLVSDMGNDPSGIRRGGQVLLPASDFWGSFDSRHVPHTSKKLNDPPSGRFRTLIQDDNVYPEMPLVPPATVIGWSTGGTNLFLTSETLCTLVTTWAIPFWMRGLSVFKGIRQVIGIRNSLTLCPSWFNLLGCMACMRPLYLLVVLQIYE